MRTWWLEPVAVRRRGLLVMALIIGLACGGSIIFSVRTSGDTAKEIVAAKKDRVRSKGVIRRIARRVARVEKDRLRGRILRELRRCLLRGACGGVVRRARLIQRKRAAAGHRGATRAPPVPADHPGVSVGPGPSSGPPSPSSPGAPPSAGPPGGGAPSPAPSPSPAPPPRPEPLLPLPDLNVPLPSLCAPGVRIGSCPG